MSLNDYLKNLLGELPLTAELYWLLKQRNSVEEAVGNLGLSPLKEALPGWIRQAKNIRMENPNRKKIFIFGMIKNWIRHSTF